MKPEGSLVISNVTDEDGGRYTCDAENEIGSISSQGSLKLFGEKFWIEIVRMGKNPNCCFYSIYV